jgi:hypothetical protein
MLSREAQRRELWLIDRFVTITSPEPITGWVDDRLRDLQSAVPSDPSARSAAQLDIAASDSGWTLATQGRLLAVVPTPEDAFDQLVSWANAAAAAAPADSPVPYLAVHAAAAEHNGTAVVLAAPSGLGKTTLCAALVKRGWRYLSDELAPITADHVVLPHPKPLTVKASGWSLLGTSAAEPHGAQRRYVRPDELGATVAPASPVAALLFVAYRSGPGQLQPLGTTATALALAGQVHTPTVMDLRAVGALASSVNGFALGCDDLDVAARHVETARQAAPRRARPFTYSPLTTVARRLVTAKDLTLASRLGPADGIEGLVLDDGGLLHHRRTGRLVALNRRGTEIWPALDGAASLAELASTLAARHDTEAAVIEADLLSLASQLAAEGLLGE